MNKLADIEALAQALFRAADPSGVWEWQDHGTQLYWRWLASERYKKISSSL